jgi:hypothetical protein
MSAQLASAPVAARATWTRLAMLAVVLIAALGFSLLVGVWLVPSSAPSRTVTYAFADLEVGVPREVRPAAGLPPDEGGRRTSIWLVRQPDQSVSAFWSETARRSDCGVTARKVSPGDSLYASFAELAPGTGGTFWLLRTPCHGSTFALDGRIVFGPAPRGLDSFPTRIEGSSVAIDLAHLVLGACRATVSVDCSPPAGRITQPFPPSRAFPSSR